MKKPLLTVAIPTFNAGKNLTKAILSCKHIKLPPEDLEILVVDNASTDDSIKEVEKLADDMKCIRIVRNKYNIGRVENWNKCLEEGKGKYLLFLFSNDEIYEYNKIKEMIEFNLKRNYPTIMFNTLYFDGHQSWKFYNYEAGEWHLEDFIKKIFIKNMTAFGILQSHVFDFEIIRQNKIYFDTKLERTTDRTFIFDVINTKKTFYIDDSILTIWHLNKNRYHYWAHIDTKNISAEELYNKFYALWIQEMKANLYILEKFGYSEIKSYELFLSYIFNTYYKWIIRKTLNKLKVLKYEHAPLDMLLIDFFVKYLRKYNDIKSYSKTFFLSLRMKIFIEVLVECFIKILKLIKSNFLKRIIL